MKSTDKKLVIQRSIVSADAILKKKIRSLDFKYSDIENLVQKKEFKTKEEKNDYYIIQFSFMLRNKDKKEIFICNREPVGFDREDRITSGLSLLFSVSNASNTIEEAIESKIKNSMLFFDTKKLLINSLSISMSQIGKGINELVDGPTYIFFVYEVNISGDVFDIISSKQLTGKTFDVDYVFKINEHFLSYTYESFMNEKAHFDICLAKDGIAKKSKYKNAFFAPQTNSSKYFTLDYSPADRKSLFGRIKKHFKDNFGDIVSDITILQDETSLPHIIDLVRCLWKVPISILTINKNIFNF